MDDFSALIAELDAFQQSRANSDRPRQPAARRTIGPQGVRMRKGLRLEMHAAVADITREMRGVEKRAATTATSAVVALRTDQRARIQSTMAKAMQACAAGEMTAAEIARLEAAATRAMERLA